MSQGLIIFLYCVAAYGLSNMMVFGSGPFRIFERIRSFAQGISEHFGTLFSCMMCFPANLGLFASLINWFLIPVALTPFNILLAGTSLWWLAALCDCCFTSGIVWFVHHVELFFENLAEGNIQAVTEEDDENEIEVHG